MLVIDNGDAIRGIAEVASKLDFIVNGYVGTTATQLADGQLADAEGDLYASGADATVVTSITIVNTDTSARTFTLYLKPSGGTSRAISPVSLDLGVGHSFYTDGQRIVVMDLNGSVVTTLALSDASPNTIEPDDSASAGTGTLASRADHEHAIAGAAPSELADVQAAGEGSSTSFARADHVHQIQHDITDNHLVTIDGSPNSGEYTVWTANGLDGKSLSEFLTLILASALPENLTIILDALLSADEKWSGISEIGTMGYGNTTVGDLVYLAVADTKWELAKADVAATSKGKLGLVLEVVAEDATCQVLLYGKMRSAAFPAFTVGAPVHVSAATAGDMVVAAPTGTTDFVVRIIGYGNTAEDLFFCPDNTYLELA